MMASRLKTDAVRFRLDSVDELGAMPFAILATQV